MENELKVKLKFKNNWNKDSCRFYVNRSIKELDGIISEDSTKTINLSFNQSIETKLEGPAQEVILAFNERDYLGVKLLELLDVRRDVIVNMLILVSEIENDDITISIKQVKIREQYSIRLEVHTLGKDRTSLMHYGFPFNSSKSFIAQSEFCLIVAYLMSIVSGNCNN